LKPSGKYSGRSARSWRSSCGNEIFIERRIVAWRLFNGNGKTLAENLAVVPDLNDGSNTKFKSIKKAEIFKFYTKSCRRRLCCKISGNEGEYFEGDAIVLKMNMMS
jgi:dihydroxy-acid dehydratase